MVDREDPMQHERADYSTIKPPAEGNLPPGVLLIFRFLIRKLTIIGKVVAK